MPKQKSKQQPLAAHLRYSILKRTECYHVDSTQADSLFDELREYNREGKPTYLVLTIKLSNRQTFNLFPTDDRSKADAELVVRSVEHKAPIVTLKFDFDKTYEQN